MKIRLFFKCFFFILIAVSTLYFSHPYIHGIWSERTPSKLWAIHQASQLIVTQKSATSLSFTPVSWNDIHITVKTTKANHQTRYALQRKTWINLTKQNVFIVTDYEESSMREDLGSQLIVIDCPRDRPWTHLCCKVGKEFDSFIESNKKWWCQIDDDVYLNQDMLLKLLNQYNSDGLVYIGKQVRTNGIKTWYRCWQHKHFFLTGASVCWSRPLAELMTYWMSYGKFSKFCDSIFTYEDVAIGFLVTKILNVPLTESPLFHTHAESLSQTMRNVNLTEQITFSYKGSNVTPFYNRQPAFTTQEDPTRFLSIHCMFHPDDHICRRRLPNASL